MLYERRLFMFLIIVGTGAMGQMVNSCAMGDSNFDKIYMVEPIKNNWPKEKADLIVDFSHPKAIKGIYEYARNMGGGIPVVIGTTGQTDKEEHIIELLKKICPVLRKSNFSRGIDAMSKLVELCQNLMPESDIAVEEIHHTKKIDMPSGTAKTLCDILQKDYASVYSIRIGSVSGKHTVYFALDDEVIEVTHTAFSKRIFAIGALEAGKQLLESNNI